MKQILEGVVIIHKNDVFSSIQINKVIHRDLKPDNIMFKSLGDYTSLKIVDFGLATKKSVDKFNWYNHNRFLFPKCGTPGFVAPEVLNLSKKTDKYTEACDVFSCGAIFYKLYENFHIIEDSLVKVYFRALSSMRFYGSTSVVRLISIAKRWTYLFPWY